MMLGAEQAAVVTAALFVGFGFVGMAAGGLFSLIARRRWGWRSAAADWALAVAASFIFGIAALSPAIPPTALDWINTISTVVAASVVVARRLAPLLLRRAAAKRPPA